ncbi:MAG: hypothetical protein IJX89_02875 [Alphaproteobacteria bacterium]|nr:hypothetical protein [Alphaproteobacteria bacterium]
MKKLAILTSILALTACGGGSGGSGGGAGIGGAPTGNTTPIIPEIGGATAVENVAFDGDYVVSTNDKGQIIALAETWETPEGETNGVTYHVVPETGKISSIEYPDGENKGVLEDGAVQLYGRRAGLKFADFGMMYVKTMVSGYETEATWAPLLAGNSDKEIQTVNGTNSFTGSAVAVIGSDITDGSDVMITNTDDANLVFNGTTGAYTLVMDFTKSDADKWYKVRYNSATDTTGQNIAFSNPDNVDIDNTFALANVSEPISMDDMGYASVSVNFYGEDATASEATAELGVYDLEGAIGNTVHFHSTFGGKVAQ